MIILPHKIRALSNGPKEPNKNALGKGRNNF
jgi:hypothetical protein